MRISDWSSDVCSSDLDWFHIEVAAYPEMHPQASSAQADLDHFVNKVQAGANSAITQYFFNADAYYDFVDRAQARGVGVPIVPGIMPITNYTQLSRFSNMCGAEIPRWIRLRLADFGDDKASIKDFGVEVISRLSQDLLDNGAPGLHFYTLNNAEVKIGRAHVRTPVTNAHLVCRILLAKKNHYYVHIIDTKKS